MWESLLVPLQIYLMGFVISLGMAMLINLIVKLTGVFNSKEQAE